MPDEATTQLSKYEKKVLDFIYERYNQRGNPVLITIMELQEIARQESINKKDIDKFLQESQDYYFLEIASTIDYSVTPRAILSYETNFPGQQVYHNHRIRRNILSYLNEQFEENPNALLTEEDFAKDERLSQYSQGELLRNLWIIESIDLIKGSFLTGGAFHFSITTLGREVVNDSLRFKSTFPISDNERISLESVGEVVNKWIPRHKRRSEETYKAELAEYLRGNGFPKTTEERGESLCDVLVDRVVPIELKIDPNKAELDRLSGQLLDMKKEYGCAIGCIIGASRKGDLMERFSERYEKANSILIIAKP